VVQRRFTKMINNVEGKTHEERLQAVDTQKEKE